MKVFYHTPVKDRPLRSKMCSLDPSCPLKVRKFVHVSWWRVHLCPRYVSNGTRQSTLVLRSLFESNGQHDEDPLSRRMLQIGTLWLYCLLSPPSTPVQTTLSLLMEFGGWFSLSLSKIWYDILFEVNNGMSKIHIIYCGKLVFVLCFIFS